MHYGARDTNCRCDGMRWVGSLGKVDMNDLDIALANSDDLANDICNESDTVWGQAVCRVSVIRPDIFADWVKVT